jgi:hypothetical protein
LFGIINSDSSILVDADEASSESSQASDEEDSVPVSIDLTVPLKQFLIRDFTETSEKKMVSLFSSFFSGLVVFSL